MSKNTPYYIQGMGHISPQLTFDNGEFLDHITEYQDNLLTSVVPDFKQYINPIQIRRMSSSLRIGLSAAKICLQDAKLDMPDAIITASGFGSLGDTHRFVHEIIDNGEKQLTPTFFMQSTYNSLSGLIAMSLKCNNYNTTYAHRGFAFETGLQDAMMQLNDVPGRRILLGSYDECNADQFLISKRSGVNRKTPIHNLSLFQTEEPGTLQGESAAFFALGTEITDNTYCRINGLKMVYAPKQESDLISAINTLLAEHGLTDGEIDVVINGAGGDKQNDQLSNEVINRLFADTQQVVYKHLVGDYCTSASFGVWLAAKMIRHQRIPDVVKVNHPNAKGKIRNTLVINHFWRKSYGIILLSGI